MAVRITVIALLATAWLSAPVRAQQPDVGASPEIEASLEASRLQAGSPQAGAARPEIDVSKLPVDLGRLQQKLRESAAREQRDGPTLRYTIDVFARAPRIQLFTPQDNLRYGPTTFSAPSHQDMINIVTPREFRTPIMDFGNLIRWLNKRSKDEKDKK